MKKLAPLIFAVLVLSACSATPRIPNPRMSAPPGPLQLESSRRLAGSPPPSRVFCETPPPSAITEIALERTGCFGFCPMYTVYLRADGTAEYRGYGNVLLIGTHVGRLSPESFQVLAHLADDLGIFDLESDYSCLVTDNPTVYVALTKDATRKTIRHYAPDDSGPPRLWWFEQCLDRIVDGIRWQ